eukprot:3683235-Alexandrium_andersonii.AAC.2
MLHAESCCVSVILWSRAAWGVCVAALPWLLRHAAAVSHSRLSTLDMPPCRKLRAACRQILRNSS